MFGRRLEGARFRGALIVLASVLGLCGAVPSGAVPRELRPEMESFIDDMARRHQFEHKALRRLFSRAEPRPGVIRAMSAPPTARPWHEFRIHHVDEMRIAAGVKFWRQNSGTLARASRQYGVPEEIIVATIGIETFYGRNTGSFKVLEALVMLAFDYPRRAEFFRNELEEFLLLTREARLDVLSVRGSFAGAMGIPQFLPSSYRKYAVDFDGDGRIDLWRNAADAIGSVANYYHTFGWQTGAVIAVRVEAGETEIDAVLAAGIKPHMSVGELRRRGVLPLVPVSDDAEAALFMVETDTGPSYWLGLQNFYVITRYNRSINYAMAVYELAREIRRRIKVDVPPAER